MPHYTWLPVIAAARGRYDAMLVLLRHNAHSDAQDREGRSPLTWACRRLEEEAADLLLRWGADETSVDDNGRSAYELIGAAIEEQEELRTGRDHVEPLRRVLQRIGHGVDGGFAIIVLCHPFQKRLGAE